MGGAHVRQIRDQNAAGTPYWQALCILSPNRRRFRILRWRDNRKRCSDQTAPARRNRAPNLGTYRRSVRWDAGAVKFRVVCAQAYKLSPSSRSRAISISFCTALPMATSSARRSQTATVNFCFLCRGSVFFGWGGPPAKSLRRGNWGQEWELPVFGMIQHCKAGWHENLM